MLTVTSRGSDVSSWEHVAQNETPLTDKEISERVMDIRRGWSVQERVARRREAERRFAELVDALSTETSAA